MQFSVFLSPWAIGLRPSHLETFDLISQIDLRTKRLFVSTFLETVRFRHDLLEYVSCNTCRRSQYCDALTNIKLPNSSDKMNWTVKITEWATETKQQELQKSVQNIWLFNKTTLAHMIHNIYVTNYIQSSILKKVYDRIMFHSIFQVNQLFVSSKCPVGIFIFI